MGFCLALEKIHTNKGRQLKAISKNTKRSFFVNKKSQLALGLCLVVFLYLLGCFLQDCQTQSLNGVATYSMSSHIIVVMVRSRISRGDGRSDCYIAEGRYGCVLGIKTHTLPETESEFAPEDRPFAPKGKSNHQFSGAYVSLREGIPNSNIYILHLKGNLGFPDSRFPPDFFCGVS